MNKLKTGILTLFLTLCPINSPSSDSKTQLDSLSSVMLEKGNRIDTLISDPRFVIYEDIDMHYITSPEQIARNKYKNARGKQRDSLFLQAYETYREILGLEDKKNNFPDFVKKYTQTLDNAEARFEIPKEILAAVIGIESDYGKNNGRFNPFNAYVSLYLTGYRREFAFQQLQELLNYCNKNNIGVFDLQSSYAGAIGYCQFIPSSLNTLFLGTAIYDMDTCIMSVANYLRHHLNRTGNLERSILKYNNDSCYLEAVLELSKQGKD